MRYCNLNCNAKTLNRAAALTLIVDQLQDLESHRNFRFWPRNCAEVLAGRLVVSYDLRPGEPAPGVVPVRRSLSSGLTLPTSRTEVVAKDAALLRCKS